MTDDNQPSTSSIRHSRICSGWVRHRRFTPKKNAFQYRVFMMYVDLDELDAVFAKSRFWSVGRWGLAQFRRQDFWGDHRQPLKKAVLQTVQEQTGLVLNGPVRMLTNFRYLGYITNPLTTYYCFEADGVTLRAILANVNNTPWGESHGYALAVDQGINDQWFKCDFEKCFHVSPFNPIEMHYQWRSNTPGDNIGVHLENWKEGEKIMDATLHLNCEPITPAKLHRVLIQYPLMTVKVIGLIYWQAMKLWLKKVPFYAHPTKTAN